MSCGHAVVQSIFLICSLIQICYTVLRTACISGIGIKEPDHIHECHPVCTSEFFLSPSQDPEKVRGSSVHPAYTENMSVHDGMMVAETVKSNTCKTEQEATV